LLMRRFIRNNGITEGFHTKMEVLPREPTASATSRITNSELRYCVLEIDSGAACPGEARREGLPGPGVETGMFAITV
jgi:hypothetical protein